MGWVMTLFQIGITVGVVLFIGFLFWLVGRAPFNW